MKFTKDEVMQFVEEEDVKFIRLAFCDVYGKQKNLSIMPSELPLAFTHGIAIDASAIQNFGEGIYRDLFLRPDADTLSILPWRPEHGKVVRMFCSVTDQNGKPFENDTRTLLKTAVRYAEEKGYHFTFGSEMEFYLFRLNEDGEPTKIPYDKAQYMDIAPEDKGENVRREICLTLEQMGITPEFSHHERGPGQNEIDFRYSDPLSAADNALTFCTVVKTVAARNGLYASFSPKPLDYAPGSGFQINIAVHTDRDTQAMPRMIAGVLAHAAEMTAFLNPAKQSYARLGTHTAPKYISWSSENRSQLVRIPDTFDRFKHAELRSPDPLANPYLAFALLIYAAVDGMEQQMELPAVADCNLFKLRPEELSRFDRLPETLENAKARALESAFIREHLPQRLLDIYCG